MSFLFGSSSTSVSKYLTNTGTKTEQEKCQELIKKCEMFKKVTPQQLETLSSSMEPKLVAKGTILLEQGKPSDRFFILGSGDIRRKHIDPDDNKVHNVQYSIKGFSVGSMRVLEGGPVHSTVKCISDGGCKVYEMSRENFLALLQKDSTLGVKIAEGLCAELRQGSKKYQTPFLQQQQQDVNIPAVSIAAGIESYYRSALNAMLNARLTGVKADLFPNMHIQVPTRISYIVGFKGLRSFLEKNIDVDSYENPNVVRLAEAIGPGIIMTPISSVLEATNAGHMNNEPMKTRWIRGLVPRCGREIIFGIGLNQMSDYFEERIESFLYGVPISTSSTQNEHEQHQQRLMIANAAGSLAAGVVSGYFSHVPHNLSTFKLLEPNVPYGVLYSKFVDKSVPPIVDKMVKYWPENRKHFARYVFATLCPRGVIIRTTQIVGSFMILNGAINYLQLREQRKIQFALNGPTAAIKV